MTMTTNTTTFMQSPFAQTPTAALGDPLALQAILDESSAEQRRASLTLQRGTEKCNEAVLVKFKEIVTAREASLAQVDREREALEGKINQITLAHRTSQNSLAAQIAALEAECQKQEAALKTSEGNNRRLEVESRESTRKIVALQTSIATNKLALGAAYLPGSRLPLSSPSPFSFQSSAAVSSPSYFEGFGLLNEPVNPSTSPGLASPQVAPVTDYKASSLYRPLSSFSTNEQVMETVHESTTRFIIKMEELLERGDALPEKERQSYQALMRQKMGLNQKNGGKHHFFGNLKEQDASWQPKGVEWLAELDRYSEKILQDHIEVASGWKKDLTHKEPLVAPYLMAPVSATWKAAKDLLGMAIHPWDCLVKPMAHLACHPIDGVSDIFHFLKDHAEYIGGYADGPEAVEMVVQAFVEWKALARGASAAGRFIRTNVSEAGAAASSAPRGFHTALHYEQNHLRNVFKVVDKKNPVRGGDSWQSAAMERIRELTPPNPESDLAHYLRSTKGVTIDSINEGAVRVIRPSNNSLEALVEKTAHSEDVLREMLHLRHIHQAQPRYFSVPKLRGFSTHHDPSLATFYMTHQPGLTIAACVEQASAAKNYAGLTEAFTQMGKAYAELNSITRGVLPEARVNTYTRELIGRHADVTRRIRELSPEIKAPYTAEEILALGREFKQTPPIAGLALDDPHMANILWDAPSKQLSLIDIGGTNRLPRSAAPRLDMHHPYQGFSEALYNAEINLMRNNIPVDVRTSLLASLREGYHSFSRLEPAGSAFKFFRVQTLYDELIRILDNESAADLKVNAVEFLYKMLEREK